jgi:hypothetical protein
MTKTKTVLTLMIAGLWLAGARTADAQTAGAQDTKFFIDVNGGVQLGHHQVDSVNSFPLYDETATVTGSQSTGNGGMFDLGLGYKFMPQFGVSLGFSAVTGSADAPVTAKIPNPIFFDQPLTINTTATGLKRSERDLHLRLIWFTPINDKMDVALSAGLSGIKLRQDIPSGTVATGTQNFTPTAAQESATAIGFNVGFDGTYLVTPQIGIALVVHFVIGSVDLPSASSVGVGGFQTGVGLHFRF